MSDRAIRQFDSLAGVADAGKALLREVKRIVQQFLPDAELWLYGSSARGERRPDSDWDVLILTGAPVPRAEQDGIRDVVYDLELERHAFVSLRFYSREQWETSLVSVSPFRINVERDAVAL
jgi:uncharacterized protein